MVVWSWPLTSSYHALALLLPKSMHIWRRESMVMWRVCRPKMLWCKQLAGNTGDPKMEGLGD